MTMKPSLLERLQRKLGRYAIPNLMLYIVAGMAIVFVIDMIVAPMTGFSASGLFAFSKPQILRGQVWRLVTFVLIPPSYSPLWLVFTLYLYWIFGSGLQQQWGSFRFNLFYLCGVVGSAIAGMITGYTTNAYLNMSLLLAFAMIYPDFQMVLFFILPVKIKWLALIDAALLLLMLITGTWASRLVLALSLANVALFFWRDALQTAKNAYRRYQWKKNWRR